LLETKEYREMDQRPADHIIYKKRAALQFSLKAGAPIPISGGTGNYTGTKKGILFVVAAASSGERSYDWANKVTLGINEHEIAKLIRGLKGVKQSFFHDRNMGDPSKQGQETKIMSISPSEDGEVLFVNISEKKHGKENKIPGVPITKDEAVGLTALLESAIPRVLGWA